MAIIKFFSRIFLIKVVVERLRRDKREGNWAPTPGVEARAEAARAQAAVASSQSTKTPASGSKASQRSAPDGSVPVPEQGGPGPDSPTDLTKPDWKATLKRTLKEVKSDRIPLASAGMAYYFFLAIFPGLIAVIGIFGLANLDAGPLIDTISKNVPGGAGAVLTDALRNPSPSETTSLYATIFGIALALYSASSGMVALQMGLNVAYDVEEDRKFIGARLTAFALLLAVGLLGGVPSPFFSFGEDLIFTIIGWVLTVTAVIILFSVFYYLAPNRPERPPWKWVSVGGLVGAALWIGSSVGFGYYASNFGNYGKTYGTLAGVIILIFWLFLSAFSVLVGGELNAELERQAAKRS
jgi:membrane protein